LAGVAATFTGTVFAFADRMCRACYDTRPCPRGERVRSENALLLMIDNYDSFTFNLVQYFGELGEDVRVIRNDAMTLPALRALRPSAIVISPGPGTPDDAGVSLEILQRLGGEVPVFGVCLGHQSIGQAFGGKVIRAKQIMHGKTSMIHHAGKGVFADLPNPFEATRYHSLVVEQSSLPDCLEVTAWTENADGSLDEIMGLRHRTLPIEGVQFHPESILTQHGHALLRNFLAQALPKAA
jgi:anthranilate synthase component 2